MVFQIASASYGPPAFQFFDWIALAAIFAAFVLIAVLTRVFRHTPNTA